jgi:hypothetical protein
MLYSSETEWNSMTPTEQRDGVAAYTAYTQALTKAGVLKDANRLQDSVAASTVRVKNGKSLVLDGPFAESKEQLGGYYLIDVADREAALAWAAKCPGANHGVVEVRPLWQ